MPDTIQMFEYPFGFFKLDLCKNLYTSWFCRVLFILFVDLTDATVRRHYGTLDTAIKKARESKYEAKLKNTTKKAEEVRNEVYSTWIHEILEMKPSTVAELKTYKNPPSAIFDTMKAVYLLLGESADMIKVCLYIKQELFAVNESSTLFKLDWCCSIFALIFMHHTSLAIVEINYLWGKQVWTATSNHRKK